jgi:hypothetical protein
MRQAAGEAEAANMQEPQSQEQAPPDQVSAATRDCGDLETEVGSDSQSDQEKLEEARRIRRLQLMMNMVMLVIQQDRSLPVEEASAMVADARRAALTMFPDKTLAFDLIFWPRLQRMMRERYRMQ